MTTTMNMKQPATITDIEDAATVRWLARSLATARAEARRHPSAAAIDRMRVRVFGERTHKPRERVAA
ncbi:MAG TPA: hypothetical protein VFY79_06125 [Dehalococcoidia bacterium]|jgi:hypothetical protein|nr:hypothetical protein [Dehalococcoidia bacterium]